MTTDANTQAFPAVVTDRHFIINPTTKEIESRTRHLNLTQRSQKSDRFVFTIPDVAVEGHDLAACNSVLIHFENIGEDLGQRNAGVYEVKDLTVGPGSVTLSWLIEEESTLYAGGLIFSIHFACIAEDGTVDYKFPTATYSRVTVGPTVWNSNTIIQRYPDIIADFAARIAALETSHRSAVLCVPQKLTPEEQAQAKENIGVKDVMTVTLDLSNETASHSFSEIKAHVEAGGTVVATSESTVYQLSCFFGDRVLFTCLPDEAFIYYCVVDESKACSASEIPLAPESAIPMIVTLDTSNKVASHSFSEIKAHVEAGGTVIARTNDTGSPLNTVYCLSGLDDNEEMAIFSEMSFTGYLSNLLIYDDKTYSLFDTAMATKDEVNGAGGALAAVDDGNGNVTLAKSGDENDHIVEQGIKDKWSYRKWASGVAECWRTVTSTVKTTDWKDSGMMSFLSYGLFWTRDVKIQLNYPFAFASRPVETACMTNGTVWFPLSLISTTGKQLDRTDSYRICTYKVPEQDIEVTISFHVIGMWK